MTQDQYPKGEIMWEGLGNYASAKNTHQGDPPLLIVPGKLTIEYEQDAIGIRLYVTHASGNKQTLEIDFEQDQKPAK